MKRIIKFKNIILFGSLVFSISIYPQENILKKEFILQGLKYHLSLIEDAQASCTLVVEDSSGMKIIRQMEWKYKPSKGKEYMRIVIMEETKSQKKMIKTIKASLDYFHQKGIELAIFGEGVKLSSRPEAYILNTGRIWTFTNRSFFTIPPSSLFWLLWPGVTIEDVLTDPNSEVLPKKEFIDGDECCVVYLPKFSRFPSKFSVHPPEKDFLERWGYSGGYKIWIAIKKGFFPKRIETWAADKIDQPFVVFETITLKNFGKEIWFPTQAVFFFPVSKHPKKTIINYTNIKINQGIKDEEFEIKFPKGTEVYDERTGIEFIAK